jgi:hypothetical protein
LDAIRMKLYKTYLLALIPIILSGCGTVVTQPPALSDGVYRMESDIKKVGVERNYGGVWQCKVTAQATSIRIAPEAALVWFEGSITDRHILFSTQQQNPDPMIKGMQLSDVWKGEIRANDYAEGVMNSYTGTNKFLSGTWSLKKIK